MKKSFLGSVFVFVLSVSIVLAAAPDGLSGPWADGVVSFNQGTTNTGGVIVPNRSDATQALGISETTGDIYDSPVISGTFTSLGFGGEIVLKFQNFVTNGEGNDIKVFEVTGGSNYPDEQVEVMVSSDGVEWYNAGQVTRDGEIDIGELCYAQFIKITDITNPNIHSNSADAYDLDGVMALHSSETSPDCGEEESSPWLGEVRTQGYWKNHDSLGEYTTTLSWRKLNHNPKVKGDACQIFANQAIAFINNWRYNDVYEGANFRSTYFDSLGQFAGYDGQTMSEIKQAAKEYVVVKQCGDYDRDTLLELKDVLDFINNGQHIWY